MPQNKLKAIKGQKPTRFAITSNDLLTGDVVYLSVNGTWVLDIAGAKHFASESVAEGVTQHSHAACADKIVGAYVIGLDEAGQPISNRETLRTTGPSNYFHGKQQIT